MLSLLKYKGLLCCFKTVLSSLADSYKNDLQESTNFDVEAITGANTNFNIRCVIKKRPLLYIFAVFLHF